MGKVFILDENLNDQLLGSRGDDFVRGSTDKPAIWIGIKGSIRLREGHDQIRSRSFIRSYGPIHTGAGRDLITGRKGLELRYREINSAYQGTIQMGLGNDTISVPEGRLFMGESTSCHTGAGNDVITAKSAALFGAFVSTGTGDDRFVIEEDLSTDLLRLEMGAGDDELSVLGVMQLYDWSDVNMGAGTDVVDASGGGLDLFENDAGFELNLGEGDDRFIGFAAAPPIYDDFGDGILSGNRGIDTIVLPQGVYTVTPNRISTASTYLPLRGFEALEGINGGRFPYATGVLTVDNSGIASFTAAGV
ncbi:MULTISPECIES: hypothetical protein [Aphanothece]|uniref:hypothetical protein n=1 Tax=Aphanothece TaxID=1121 RepID=UPI0039846D0E